MPEYRLTKVEAKFADLIWNNEPIASGELVRLSAKELSWKSTTSYTVLRRLCDRGIFQNESSVVTSLMKRDEFYGMKSKQFVEDTFGGSLPKFLASFIGAKKLNQGQIDEIKHLIDSYEEGADA